MDCSPPGSSVHGDSLVKNTGIGFHALFQGIFPTQGSNPGLSHCRRILYHLSHQRSPRIPEWVADPLSRGLSGPRNWTRVSCIVGRFFTSWATREAHIYMCTHTHTHAHIYKSYKAHTYVCIHTHTYKRVILGLQLNKFFLKRKKLYWVSRKFFHKMLWKTLTNFLANPIQWKGSLPITATLATKIPSLKTP